MVLNFYRMVKDGVDTVKNGLNDLRIKDMVFNAFIVGMIAFFSTWDGTLNIDNILTSVKAFGLSFFIELAYEKGIKRFKGGTQ